MKKLSSRCCYVLLIAVCLITVGIKASQADAAACVTPPSGLISWWGGDNNVLDLIGTNHGTIMNGATYAAGMVGQAFSLNGSDQYIQDSSPAGLPVGGSARTVMAWIRSAGPTQLNGKPTHTYQAIIGYGTPDATYVVNGQAFVLEWGGDVNDRKLLLLGWNADTIGSTTLNYGQWYHVAATYDGTNVNLYIDGQLDTTAARSLNTVINGDGLLLGNAPANDEWHARFNGMIDEPAIYNHALTAQEIAAIYSAGSAGICRPCTAPTADLVDWWPGEDSAVDRLGGHDGTVAGATYAPGIVGRAFQFDGIDDAIGVGMLGTIGLNEASPFSISAWINPTDTNGYQVIAGNYMGEGGGTGNFSTYLMVINGSLNFALNMRQIDGITVSTPISAGWHHVSATYDGTAMTLYLDGHMSGTAARNFSGAIDNTRGWYVGNHSPATNASHGNQSAFKGSIDEVMIYSRALTADEVAKIYNAGSAGICGSCAQPPTGMLAWWKGQDSANDSAGTNHGTVSGTVNYAPGTVDQGFSFDGSASYIEVPNFIPALPAFSFSFWMNINSFTNQSYMAPFCQGTANGVTWCFYAGNESVGAFGLQGTWSTPYDFFDMRVPIPFGAGAWKHVSVTYDGSSMKQYVDSVLLNENTYFGKTLGNAEPFIIGRGTAFPSGSQTTTYFDGVIDELTVYNRALSPSEVEAVFNAGSSGKCGVPAIRRDRAGSLPAFFDTYSLALAGVQTGDNIFVRSIDSSEAADYNNAGASALLQGGCDIDFVPDPAKYSSVSGSLTISSGALDVTNLIIK